MCLDENIEGTKRVQETNNGLKFKVQGSVQVDLTEKCWVKKESNELLEHEQGH